MKAGIYATEFSLTQHPLDLNNEGPHAHIEVENTINILPDKLRQRVFNNRLVPPFVLQFDITWQTEHSQV